MRSEIVCVPRHEECRSLRAEFAEQLGQLLTLDGVEDAALAWLSRRLASTAVINRWALTDPSGTDSADTVRAFADFRRRAQAGGDLEPRRTGWWCRCARSHHREEAAWRRRRTGGASRAAARARMERSEHAGGDAVRGSSRSGAGHHLPRPGPGQSPRRDSGHAGGGRRGATTGVVRRGKWEAMHDDMSGFYEVRVRGADRRNHRIFCISSGTLPISAGRASSSSMDCEPVRQAADPRDYKRAAAVPSRVPEATNRVASSGSCRRSPGALLASRLRNTPDGFRTRLGDEIELKGSRRVPTTVVAVGFGERIVKRRRTASGGRPALRASSAFDSPRSSRRASIDLDQLIDSRGGRGGLPGRRARTPGLALLLEVPLGAGSRCHGCSLGPRCSVTQKLRYLDGQEHRLLPRLLERIGCQRPSGGGSGDTRQHVKAQVRGTIRNCLTRADTASKRPHNPKVAGSKIRPRRHVSRSTHSRGPHVSRDIRTGVA